MENLFDNDIIGINDVEFKYLDSKYIVDSIFTILSKYSEKYYNINLTLNKESNYRYKISKNKSVILLVDFIGDDVMLTYKTGYGYSCWDHILKFLSNLYKAYGITINELKLEDNRYITSESTYVDPYVCENLPIIRTMSSTAYVKDTCFKSVDDFMNFLRSLFRCDQRTEVRVNSDSVYINYNGCRLTLHEIIRDLHLIRDTKSPVIKEFFTRQDVEQYFNK